MHRNKARVAVSRALAVAGLATLTALATPGAAWAAGTDAGLALIVSPSNPNTNINSGGSQNIWAFRLPSGAACTGDGAAGYRVQTYIADATTNPNPGDLTFNNDGPVGNGTVFPLYDQFANPFVNILPENGTGKVVFGAAGFDLNLFSIDGRTTPRNPDGTLTLPAGTYNLGVACSRLGQGDRYWNTQIVVAPNAGDVNGESWQTQPNPQVPEFPLSVVLPLSAAAILGGGWWFSRRRRPTPAAALAA